MSTLFSQFTGILLGPSGAYSRDLIDLENAVCEALLRSFYTRNPSAGITSIKKFCNGDISVPKKIIKYYAGLSGLKRNVSDLKHLTNQCASIDRLVQAQAVVHAWLMEIHIPREYELIINTCYFPGSDNRDLIASFLAIALHLVLEMSY